MRGDGIKIDLRIWHCRNKERLRDAWRVPNPLDISRVSWQDSVSFKLSVTKQKTLLLG
jgi:hypothetical protein